jgi:hypothetical protein
MNRGVVGLLVLIGACADADGAGDSWQPELTGTAMTPASPGAEQGAADSAARLPTAPVEAYIGQSMCRILLDRSGVESASRCPREPVDAGHLQLPGKAGCLRDSYVFTAIAYCWRSECLAAQGVTEDDVLAGRASTSPARESVWAIRMLEDASRLCGRSSSACTTSEIVACPS